MPLSVSTSRGFTWLQASPSWYTSDCTVLVVLTRWRHGQQLQGLAPSPRAAGRGPACMNNRHAPRTLLHCGHVGHGVEAGVAPLEAVHAPLVDDHGAGGALEEGVVAGPDVDCVLRLRATGRHHLLTIAEHLNHCKRHNG